MLKLGARTGSLAAKLLSSAALLLASVAYAVWQQVSPIPGNHPVKIRVAAAAPVVASAPHGSGEPQLAEIPASPSVAEVQSPAHAPATAPDDSFGRAPSLPKSAEMPLPRDVAANAPAPLALDTAPAAPTAPLSPPILYAVAAPAAAAPRQHPNYADGNFTGEPVDCYWGIVQVEVQIRSGAIAEVDFLQMPDHRQRSAEISNWSATPLAQEAIQEQTAEVDIVSSATNTSSAFQQSLKTALDKALK